MSIEGYRSIEVEGKQYLQPGQHLMAQRPYQDIASMLPEG